MADKKMKRLIWFSRLLFIIYMVCMLYFLLFAEGFGRNLEGREYRYNLTVFKEITRFWNWAMMSNTGMKAMILNVFGNVLFFMPFGFFLPIISCRINNVIVVTIISFAYSIIIETIQLVSKVGSFDVDDIILNTIGGLLGFVFYYICKRLKREKLNI